MSAARLFSDVQLAELARKAVHYGGVNGIQVEIKTLFLPNLLF